MASIFEIGETYQRGNGITISSTPASRNLALMRMFKKPVSKAAASEDRRRTLWGTLRI